MRGQIQSAEGWVELEKEEGFGSLCNHRCVGKSFRMRYQNAEFKQLLSEEAMDILVLGL